MKKLNSTISGLEETIKQGEHNLFMLRAAYSSAINSNNDYLYGNRDTIRKTILKQINLNKHLRTFAYQLKVEKGTIETKEKESV